MSEKMGYEDLIQRAIVDPKFRTELVTDPERVVSDEGYELPDEVMEQLKAIDHEAAELAAKEIEQEFGNRKAAT